MSCLEWIFGIWIVKELFSFGKKKGSNQLTKAQKEEENRNRIPCRFDEGVSQELFEAFAQGAGNKIKRIESISVVGAKVYGTVRSQSNISEWMKSENDDSSIPERLGDIISGCIVQYPDYIAEEEDEDDSEYINDNVEKPMCPYCGRTQSVENPKYCAYCGNRLER